MATSGETAWGLTALDIVKLAMGELQVLSIGDDPDAEEAEECYKRLNAMLKSWQVRGASLAHDTTGTVETTASAPSVALPEGARSISSARLVVSATQERPLYAISRTDYLNLPNKAAAGSPTMYYLDRQRDVATLYLWPVSAAAATLKLDYTRSIETVTDGSEALDIREELQECVYANLAVRVAGLFGQQPGPELVARAQSLEAQMLDAERPDSYFFYAAD